MPIYSPDTMNGDFEAIFTFRNDPPHPKPLNRQGAMSIIQESLSSTTGSLSKSYSMDAPSKKRRRGNEESTSCHELVLYTGLDKNSSQDDNDTASLKLQILSLEQRVSSAQVVEESN
ncbi:hypothetical protein C0992_001197 [Termitomyces sp. T32_za158]|nr:hypothetical protein C0992_001197 [Termitomyces sp. T32_za158]